MRATRWAKELLERRAQSAESSSTSTTGCWPESLLCHAGAMGTSRPLSSASHDISRPAVASRANRR